MNARLSVILLLAGLSAAARADTHAWKDPAGLTHFSDRVGANVQDYRTVAVEPGAVAAAALQGNWISRSADGYSTSLELKPAGGFILDRRHTRSPARLYMCGSWATERRQITLQVEAQKEQHADGVISELAGQRVAELQILVAAPHRLVIRTEEGDTLTFRPTS